MPTPTSIKKTADTTYDLHPVIKDRWSPRAFSDKPIARELLLELLEAARWAPSSYNEQPWRYAYAFRGTDGFDRLADTLMPGNKSWAQHAAVLVVAMAKTTLSRNGKPNGVALHDLGLANAQLLAQATSRGIYGHLMGGFSKPEAQALLHLDEETRPVCVIALGYMGDTSTLDETLQAKEAARRSRRPLQEITQEIT
jgi:nitroreductase